MKWTVIARLRSDEMNYIVRNETRKMRFASDGGNDGAMNQPNLQLLWLQMEAQMQRNLAFYLPWNRLECELAFE